VSPTSPRYGLIGVFREPEPLTAAAKALRERGYSRLDAFTPFPVPEVEDAVGASAGPLSRVVLIAGILGALATYALVLYSVEIDYPIDVGGRPLNSWPAYVVLTFEGGILAAALAAFFGVLVLCKLPAYYDPVFNAASFGFAGEDRFFLLVRADDPEFSDRGTRKLLRDCGALTVEWVAP
jgi:hypothetical protein